MGKNKSGGETSAGALRELALFAGAGGGILGGKLLGWRTVCAVEIDAYARNVLLARQRDGCLPRFPIWDDVQTFDGRPWRGHVDVVSGGFPCQDISCAGKGAGIEGERSSMWAEMARIIGEVRPRFAFVENSPMLVGRGLAVVLGDLAALGYDARWCVLGARHAKAPHKRDRIWILGHANSHGESDVPVDAEASGVPGDVANARGRRCRGPRERESEQSGRAEAVGACEDVADAKGSRTWDDGKNNGARSGEINASDNAGRVSRGDDRPQDGEAMADAKRQRLEGHSGDGDHRDKPGWQHTESNRPVTTGCLPCRAHVPDTEGTKPLGGRNGAGRRQWSEGDDEREGPKGADWWESEPDVGG